MPTVKSYCKNKRSRKTSSRKSRKISSRKRRVTVKCVKPFRRIPDIFKNISEDCHNKIWKPKNIIGQGQNGTVYVVCKADNCKYVIKKQISNYLFYREVYALSRLNNYKNPYVPKIYASWTCNGYGYIVMEKVGPCNLDDRYKIYKQLLHFVKLLKERNMYHIDIHPNNVMCTSSGNIVVIDFGWFWRFSRDEPVLRKHPLNKSYPNVKMDERVVNIIQELNINRYFCDDPKKIRKATKNWLKEIN